MWVYHLRAPVAANVSRMTPEQRIANAKKLVSAARAILSLQVGLGVGCIRIKKILGWLGPEATTEFPVFAEFLSSIPGSVPVGNERSHWSSKALLEIDQKLAKVEARFRPRILEACAEIIAIYG